MKKLILNGKKAGRALTEKMIAGLNDKALRTEKGGYLFRAGSDEKSLYLGIVPCLIEGQRTYHYDISMPGKLEYILSGGITPEGVISILFKPPARVLTPGMKAGYLRVYIDLAEGLLGRGLSEPGEFDMASRMMAESSGVFPEAPTSLADILLFR